MLNIAIIAIPLNRFMPVSLAKCCDATGTAASIDRCCSARPVLQVRVHQERGRPSVLTITEFAGR